MEESQSTRSSVSVSEVELRNRAFRDIINSKQKPILRRRMDRPDLLDAEVLKSLNVSLSNEAPQVGGEITYKEIARLDSNLESVKTTVAFTLKVVALVGNLFCLIAVILTTAVVYLL